MESINKRIEKLLKEKGISASEFSKKIKFIKEKLKEIDNTFIF